MRIDVKTRRLILLASVLSLCRTPRTRAARTPSPSPPGSPPYGTPSPRLEATLRVARPFALSSSDLFARFAVSLVSLVSRLRVPGPARGDKAANT